MPVPPRMFASGILNTAPTIFVIVMEANSIAVFFIYFLFIGVPFVVYGVSW